MKRLRVILAVCLSLWLAGCVFKRTPKSGASNRPAPAPPQEAARIREIVPPEVQQQYKQKADEVRRETQQRIANVRGQNLDRIQTFLRQSLEAEKHGEMRQAYEFADKALVLAKGL